MPTLRPTLRRIALRPLMAGLLAALVGLAACAPQPSRPASGMIAAPIGRMPAPMAAQGQSAAMLLPLSGPQAPLGQAMLNAGVMALFDEAPTGVTLLPVDTGGTPGGAAAAARQAVAAGARVLVGPLTSAEAGAAQPVARAAGLPMLAMTNDPQRAGEGAWVLGVTPAQQVRAVVAAAAREGAQRFAVAAPATDFGRALAAAMRGAASDLGLPAPTVVLHPANADPAMAAGAARMAAPQADALLIGEVGERARRFAAAYAAEARAAAGGVEPAPMRLLGPALWFGDAALRGEPALAGAWFAGPDPGARAAFEGRYREAFGDAPPRVAAAAHDAAALAARALRGRAAVATVTAGQSLYGADGPVRLLPNGQTLRGLAIYALSPDGTALLVEPAGEPTGPGS
jgi:ABC-type branched-subunit amino acid transport system substrate-binding protein